ncbi:MAG: metalloregulator ArsR/SmtB family transcription factor [Thermodesulfobacteriota bacterium]
MTDDINLARIFKCLAVEARIKIVRLLKSQTLCVNALAARLNMTQGAASQHLRLLREAGLVRPEKRGYWVHYQLNEEILARWEKAVEDLLAPPQIQLPCLTGPLGQPKEEPLCAGRAKPPAGNQKT